MPRRIILLSDGTGNSSASFWRTNVWRMFCALDLSSSSQVACYDDGVGTSSFKPLAMLGGAFGIGLRRNVISLYKFACRNFRASDDEIYAFGFSRGAFTVRVVIGLIIDQGLIPAADITETELDRQARRAYHDYHRKHFHTNWDLIIRWFTGRGAERESGQARQQPDLREGRRTPVIRFVGVWDTVAAYGLPVDEMTRGVSQWIWPLEIPSHSLHPSVLRACHALSLDDERTTFHPVLWDEDKEKPHADTPRLTSAERLSQVWFAGVHANVGGGYPDDSLAQIPMYWIMQEAKACGLVFKTANPDAVAEIREAQDKDGRLYNSRGGLGSYYRYGPRRISRLCDELFSRTLDDSVSISTPKIHESVFRRIKNHAHVYAPIGIPHEYEVVVTVPRANGVDADFRIDPLPTTPGQNTYERRQDAQARVLGERDAIWPLVYVRAGLYFLTLLTTLVFAVLPFTARSNELLERENELKSISNVIRDFGELFPKLASGWFVGYGQHPLAFLVLVGILAVLLLASSYAAAATTDRMSTLWRDSLSHAKPGPGVPPANTPTAGEKVFLGIRSGWKDYVGPALSAAVLLYVGVALANRLTFTVLDEAGLVCKASDHPKAIPEEGVLFSFDVRNPCFATGYKVDRLKRYLLWTAPDKQSRSWAKLHKMPRETGNCTAASDEKFRSGGVATDARGYGTFSNADEESLGIKATIVNLLLLPWKRHYAQSWFAPVARYSAIGGEYEFLEPDPDANIDIISENVRPKVTDELFFYFNGAVTGIPWFQPYYTHNRGCATFFIISKKAEENE